MNRNGNFLSSIPLVTKNLMIINVLVFLATKALMLQGIDLINIFGLHYFPAPSFHLYQLVTYMFLHANVSHLFFNMFALFMFGCSLERVWGYRRFIIFYFFTGIGAGLMQELVWSLMLPASEVIAPYYLNTIITIGASGAVFGILLAFGMLFPNIPLYLFFIPIPIKAKYMVIGYGIIELFSGIAGFSGDNVAHFAHLGGMLFGLILILWWRKKYGKEVYY